MKIYLLNNHEAVVVNDHGETVCVEPAVGGTLVVNGQEYPIEVGGIAPDLGGETAAHVKAAFVKEGGVVYTVIAPRLYKGVLTSRPDPYSYILTMRMMVDRLEKELEQTKKELRKHRGKEEHRALNGIFKKEA